MKYNDNGTWKDIYVKTLDSLPTGAVIDYDGDTLPDGWVEYGSNDYSYEETFTGKYWVDGKKIYRKVISLHTGTTTGTELTKAHGISNISTILPTSCMEVFAYNNTYFLPDTNIGQFYANVTNIMYQMVTSGLSNKDAVAILEYTKTTN